VRQEAPSVRHMVIKSPRGSTTEMLILTPIAITLALAAARICSASASVRMPWSVLLVHVLSYRVGASALSSRAEAPEAGRPISPVGNGGNLAPDLKAISGLKTVRSSAPH
jgi:hypothetical protein